MMRFISELIEKKRADRAPARRAAPIIEEPPAPAASAPEEALIEASPPEDRHEGGDTFILRAEHTVEQDDSTPMDAAIDDAEDGDDDGRLFDNWDDVLAVSELGEPIDDDDEDQDEDDPGVTGEAPHLRTGADLDRAFEQPLSGFRTKARDPAEDDEDDEGAEKGHSNLFSDGLDILAEVEAAAASEETEADATSDETSEPDAPDAQDDTVEKVAQTMRIWDLDMDDDEETELEEPAAEQILRPVPDPAPARLAAKPEPVSEMPRPQPQRAGRVKTRLLGFHRPEDMEPNPFARQEKALLQTELERFPVGWLAVVKGPGRGASYPLFDGVSTIGRGDDQAVALDHGDTSISRENHAAVAYDCEQQSFFIGHGGKANLVRLNGMPVLSTEPLSTGDEIRIGETTLRFVALCGPDFSWDEDTGHGARDAAAF
ncbi:FHA domain-containing protein [Tropicimonas isoalkanivorans]|uniref:FHA domain-containing protein n=1 Tax=Tropicimonas isoalkanivorans TaxID=441112 RepID=A0A1I1KBM8_9RHOB|nr:FHA domain-containing protein [Tropicimonas isoalkanivorans]SFC58287.1 FHA domain-containing protein [Tropicimonas isoalkanivorans]